MQQKSLKQKAISGMIWTFFQRFSKIGVSFVSGIVLARLLSPFDYGCIGMLAIFISIAETFIDGGFGAALIQKKNPTQEDYSTIFYWNLGMAFALYSLLFISAPYVAEFYGISILKDVLRVQGIILFLYALNLIQRNQLRKSLDFRILSIVSVLTTVISLTISIIMAYRGFGVWALVVQNLIGSTITAFVFWKYTKWRPLPVFSLKSFKELFSFGFYMFITNIVNKTSNQIHGLMIGKMYNPITTGYYSKAFTTEQLASQSISYIMAQVTYPLYAEIQDEKQQMNYIIRHLTMTLAYLTFPLLFILIMLAKPIFILIYSEKWLQSVPYFQALCIAGIAGCLQSVNLQSILAIGKSKTMFIWTLVKQVIGIGAVIIGLLVGGMKGLLVGVIVNYWFSYFVNIALVSKYIGYKWMRQIHDILPILFFSLFAVLISYYAGSIFNSIYIQAVVELLMYLFVYVLWSYLFKPESYKFFISVAYPLMSSLGIKVRISK